MMLLSYCISCFNRIGIRGGKVNGRIRDVPSGRSSAAGPDDRVPVARCVAAGSGHLSRLGDRLGLGRAGGQVRQFSDFFAVDDSCGAVLAVPATAPEPLTSFASIDSGSSVTVFSARFHSTPGLPSGLDPEVPMAKSPLMLETTLCSAPSSTG